MRHRDNTGRLVAIECDRCDSLISPNRDIAQSGWRKYGLRDQSGNDYEWHLCPRHAHLAIETAAGNQSSTPKTRG